MVATDGPSLPPPLPTSIPSAIPAFRCGVCNQVSNWKHVIQVPFDKWIETYFFDGRLTVQITFPESDLFFSFLFFFFFFFFDEPCYQRNSFSLTKLCHLQQWSDCFFSSFCLTTAPLPLEAQRQYPSHRKQSHR